MPAPCLHPADPAQRPQDAAARARALAWRLFVAHRQAPRALLEALAAADAARARAGRLILGRPPALPPETLADPAWPRCLAVAEAAEAGALSGAAPGAERYHPRGVTPVWAAERAPLAEVAGFVFYGAEV